MYIIFELYRIFKIELLFILVVRYYDASGYFVRIGYVGLCVEVVGGGGVWFGYWF